MSSIDSASNFQSEAHSDPSLQLPSFRSIFGGHWDALDGMLSWNTNNYSSTVAQDMLNQDYSEVLDQLASSLDSPTQFNKESVLFDAQPVTSEYEMKPEFYSPFDFVGDFDKSPREILMCNSNDTLHEEPLVKFEYDDDTSVIKNFIAEPVNSLEELMQSPQLSSITSYHSLNSCFSSTECLPLPKKPFLRRSFVNYQQETFCEPSTVSGKKSDKYVCPFDGCQKIFTRKANRRAHIATHNPHRARPFACHLCPKAYLRAVDLSRHIEVNHERSRKHICQECQRSFTRKEGLRKHQEKSICSS
jgi:hypothetical protein